MVAQLFTDMSDAAYHADPCETHADGRVPVLEREAKRFERAVRA